jgi:hypothetical protein
MYTVLCGVSLLQDEGKANAKSSSDDSNAAANPLQASAYTKDGRRVTRWGFLDNFHKKYNKVSEPHTAVYERCMLLCAVMSIRSTCTTNLGIERSSDRSIAVRQVQH